MTTPAARVQTFALPLIPATPSATLLLAALALAALASVAVAKDLIVTADNVNVRAAPGVSNARIAQLSKNHLVRELGRSDQWINIEIIGSQGTRGWIHRNYVDIIPETNEQSKCSGQTTDSIKDSHAEIHWNSTFFFSNNQYCFRRVVEITKDPWRYLVSWRVANIVNADVDRTFAVEAGFYDETDDEDGDLEFGYFGSTIPTTVYRGEDEPYVMRPAQPSLVYVQFNENESAAVQENSYSSLTADEKWTRLEGSVFAEGQPLRVSLFVRSGFRDVSEGEGRNYEYFYTIINKGDAITVDWASANWFLESLLKQTERPYPIDADAENFILNLAGQSPSPPVLNSEIMNISTQQDAKAMQVLVPAYVPKE
jgi:uncharacterized protein YgiM (DUF1202 family)